MLPEALCVANCSEEEQASYKISAIKSYDFQDLRLILGLPDRFIDHGDAPKLLASCGLDGAGIAASILQRFGAEFLGQGPRPAKVG